jgi:drug/metabolite transporter (DMT)-like permease
MNPELTALVAAVSYALFTVFGWHGLRYSTPLVATVVSLLARTVTLWAAVFLTGGVPAFTVDALIVFIGLGMLQSATSLLTFTGLHKIGTSRSQPLRNTYPLWSAFIAILFTGEQAGAMILGGTLLIVVGVVFISWRPDTPPPDYRAWHVVYSLAAGLLAGVAFPLRRYGLSINNEPVFFAAVVAVTSLIGSLPYLLITGERRRVVWDARSVLHFTVSGFFEAMGALLSLVALVSGPVVVVSPIVATTPLWNLLIIGVFFPGREEINARTIAGTAAIVLGTIAVAFGR